MKKFYPSLLILTIFTLACGVDVKTGLQPDSKDLEIPTSPLSGFIAGQAWKPVSAVAHVKSTDSRYIEVQFSNEPSNIECPRHLNGSRRLLTTIPAKVGEHTLGEGDEMLTVTLSNFSNGAISNTFLYKGRVDFDEINENWISGGLMAMHDDDNKAAGKFKVPLCRN